MVSMLTAEERVVLQTEAALDALSMLLQQQSLGVPSERITSLRESCEAMAAKLATLAPPAQPAERLEASQTFEESAERPADPQHRQPRPRGVRTTRRRGSSGDGPSLGLERPQPASARARRPQLQNTQPSSSDAASMADERADGPTEDEPDDDDGALPSGTPSKLAQRLRAEHEQAKNSRLTRRRAASCGSIRYSQRRGGTFSAEHVEGSRPQDVPAGAVATLAHMQQAQRTMLQRRAQEAIVEQASTTEEESSVRTTRTPATAPAAVGRGRMRMQHQAARSNRLSQRRPSFFGPNQIGTSAPEPSADTSVQAAQPPSDLLMQKASEQVPRGGAPRTGCCMTRRCICYARCFERFHDGRAAFSESIACHRQKQKDWQVGELVELGNGGPLHVLFEQMRYDYVTCTTVGGAHALDVCCMAASLFASNVYALRPSAIGQRQRVR
eukprot:CAMPEP_0183357650 /NCGR_PEP_ID=MMETSP0164_2-20130417/46912_1 /TAXON_ID=221442 /ORGANISM="Coccolithus pelagicus ssp braarudi, Strain PLY182g" /LENGTH=441 /DNA_ID=CAMNT_0025531323 /DNA_START=18 /DNA_END=1345 /DNA_ORIENTATION=-